MGGENPIRNKKSVISALVTVMVVLMLIFSGPAGAVTVEISGLSGSITKNDSKTYYIEVDIDDPDTQIPIDNLTLKIVGSTNKNVVFVPNGTILSGGGSWISITSQNTNYTSYGYGYGYGGDSGTFYNFGYGYGYGYGQTYTKLRYKVVMDTDDLDAGDYTATVYVYTGSSVHSSFSSSSASFEIAESSTTTTSTGGGGGGGGGGGTPSPEIETDSKGEVQSTFTETTVDGTAELTIPEGTNALDSEGKPLESVSILPMIPLTGAIEMFDLKPDGAKFDPPITFTVKYDPKEVPAGKTVVMKMYDDNSKKWVELETTIDAAKHTATVKISHFTIFALFTEVKRPTIPEVVPTPTPIMPTPPSRTPAPVEPPERPFNWPLVILSMISAVIVVLLAYYYRRKNGNNGV